MHQPFATAAISDDTLLPIDLLSVRRKKLTVDFDGGSQSSGGGLLLFREAERSLGAHDLLPRCRIGVTGAETSSDTRNGDGADRGDREDAIDFDRPRMFR